jgi:hypothetical protein
MFSVLLYILKKICFRYGGIKTNTNKARSQSRITYNEWDTIIQENKSPTEKSNALLFTKENQWPSLSTQSSLGQGTVS